MEELVERTLRRLGERLPGRVSVPGDDGYTAATAIWAKPIGPLPRAVVACRTATEVQLGLRAARDCELPLSVRGGGHDWAGRALCDGLVIDLSGLNDVFVNPDELTAKISGGARALDVLRATDPLGLVAATGSCSAVGMAGLTLGGGYGALIGRYGLALDNLLAAEVVLADGRTVVADAENESELFWALRGGGGNFGVVTKMWHRMHDLPSVTTGVLVYPLAEARGILKRCAEIAVSAPDGLTIQLAFAMGPDGSQVAMVVPNWCGPPHEGEALLAPFSQLGTLLAGRVAAMPYGTSLALFDGHIVNGLRTFMETCWLPTIEDGSDVLVEAMESAVSPGCAIIVHDFKGAASRVPIDATAFALRHDHMLVEILAAFVDRSE